MYGEIPHALIDLINCLFWSEHVEGFILSPKLILIGKPDKNDLCLLRQRFFLSEEAVGCLERVAQVVEATTDSQLYSQGKHYHDAMLLLSGTLAFIAPDGTRRQIEATQERTGVLPPNVPATDHCVAATPVRLLKANRTLLVRLCHGEPPSATGPLEDLVVDLRNIMSEGRIEIPTIPDVGIRISRHIEDPKIDTMSLSNLIQMDPGIAGRIVQIANSPLFGRRGHIENLHEAVFRLGRDNLRDIVIGIVLKNVFRTHERAFRQRLKELWHHSTLVASLCQVLARRIGFANSGQALLAGLLHDIGVLPVVHYANQSPILTKNPKLLDLLIGKMRGECGQYVLNHWGFGKPIVQAAISAEDWWWDSGHDRIELTDLVILAQIHSYVGKRNFSSLPRIDQIPAFAKLGHVKVLSPRLSLKILDEATEEIAALQRMLS